MNSPSPTQDASAKHWIYRLPKGWIPYAQLSRLDRPVGYWLLALPGWILISWITFGTWPLRESGWGTLTTAQIIGIILIWTMHYLLILIGAIAMRGAGCTYNDIVDRDLDAQVARTSLRPIPAGNVGVKKAKMWMFSQIGIGFLVWLCIPTSAKIVALLALPLVAAYPFMKRITWWPQLWLGLTFNWAALVVLNWNGFNTNWEILFIFAAFIFWTIGYDTIYACQDREDDALIGVKSTARLFGDNVKRGVALCYALVILCMFLWLNTGWWYFGGGTVMVPPTDDTVQSWLHTAIPHFLENFHISYRSLLILIPLSLFFIYQIMKFDPEDGENCLKLFKQNAWMMGFLALLPPASLLIANLFIYPNLTPL